MQEHQSMMTPVLWKILVRKTRFLGFFEKNFKSPNFKLQKVFFYLFYALQYKTSFIAL